MKKARISQTIVGGAFILLGLALLASVVDLLQSTAIYGFIIPLIFIFSGYGILDKTRADQRRNIGFGLIAVGIVTLLVRYNVLRGDVVNIVLGTTLVGWGLLILARLYSNATSPKISK